MKLSQLLKVLTCLALVTSLAFVPATTICPLLGKHVAAAATPSPNPASRVVAGTECSYLLLEDGSVQAWGKNLSGQLGQGDTRLRYQPTPIPGLTGVIQLAASNHALALMSDGTVKAWGSNNYGQLGLGNTSNGLSPVTISGLHSVQQVATGASHSLALLEDGTVLSWGLNDNGQLGQGDAVNRQTPTLIPNLAGVVQVAAGGSHSLALLSNGTVVAWGYNNYGQLGLGSTQSSNLPVAITGLTGVVQLAAGASFSLALLADGSLKAWGLNSSGQLGLGNSTNKSSPTAISTVGSVSKLVAGSANSLALFADGTVRVWGLNSSGQLGLGDTTNRNSPTSLTGMLRVADISAGDAHCLLRTEAGQVYLWGNNNYGQIASADRSSLAAIPGWAGSSNLVVGTNHTFSLQPDGSVLASGYNAYGQLGTGNTTSRSTPVVVPGLAGATQIAAGEFHGLALMADGSVKAFGRNNYGQLGLGDTSNRTSPTTIPGLTGVRTLVARSNYSLALLTDGRVMSWGSNSAGQLGQGDTANRNSPALINGLTGVTQLVAGGSFVLALLTDGTVKAWGYNYYGQLGLGTTVDQYSPVTITGLNGVQRLVAGATWAFAILNGGSVMAWGSNSVGQLGLDSTSTTKKTPTAAPLLAGVTTLTAGTTHNLATFTGGVVKAWGGDQFGQLGLGGSANLRAPVVIPGLTNVAQLALSDSGHTLIRLSDGTVLGCGLNQYGQLGTGDNAVKEPTLLQAAAIGASLPAIGYLTSTSASTSITVSWAPVPTAIGYDIEVDGIVLDNTREVSYQHAGLRLGTQHTYRARARTKAGTGPWSERLTAVTAAALPALVTNLVATPTDHVVTLTWDAVADAEWYDLALVLPQGGSLLLESTISPYCTVGGLAAGQTYQFTVTPRNSLGVASAAASVSATTYLLATPSELALTADDSAIYLTWQPVAGATGYLVEIDQGAPQSVTVPSYQHTGLAAEDQGHTYRIQATAALGSRSAWSVPLTGFILPTQPPTPAGITAIAAHDKINLAWAAVAAAVGYDVELDGVMVENGPETLYTHEDLSPNSEHVYRVRTRSSVASGDWSEPVIVRTPPGLPQPPGGVSLLVTGQLAEITWASQPGATGYEVEVDGVIHPVGTATSYTHRGLQRSREYTYRLRTVSDLGASPWSGYIINNAVLAQCRRGQSLDLGLASSNITDFRPYRLSVTYRPDVLEVEDLCNLTAARELAAGEVAGTGITITDFRPGQIVFQVEQAITAGYSWTGVLNSIKFRAKVTGGTTITYTVYCDQPEVD